MAAAAAGMERGHADIFVPLAAVANSQKARRVCISFATCNVTVRVEREYIMHPEWFPVWARLDFPRRDAEPSQHFFFREKGGLPEPRNVTYLIDSARNVWAENKGKVTLDVREGEPAFEFAEIKYFPTLGNIFVTVPFKFEGEDGVLNLARNGAGIEMGLWGETKGRQGKPFHLMIHKMDGSLRTVPLGSS